jgi:acyl-ACP thioesterase
MRGAVIHAILAFIAELPATELVPLPSRGSRFTGTRPVRLGDVDPAGRLRLDAVARYLQDVASDDAADAGLQTAWVARRTLIDVRRPAVLGERLELTTFCSGTGRSWAERRTAVAGAAGAHVEAVCLWVQVDATSGRPAPLGSEFDAHYGEAAGGRRVSSRLVLRAPSSGTVVRPWSVRAVDLDPLEHVNNASQWAILEEVLPTGGRAGTAELEHVLPIDAGTAVELHVADEDGATSAWLVAGGRVHTAARWYRAAHAARR